jgi:hypothetical protein
MAGLASALETAKRAASFLADKARETVDQLQQPPTEIECSNVECKRVVVVPPQLFNWRCPGCGAECVASAEACAGCSRPKPAELRDRGARVQCTVCRAFTDVPATLGKLRLNQAATAAKAAATTAADYTKRTYHHLRAAAVDFNCARCNTKIRNPNVSVAPDGAIVEETDPARRAHTVICPVCRSQVDIPGNNLMAGATGARNSVVRTAQLVYLELAGKQYARCPICTQPCAIPSLAELGPPPAQPASAQGRAGGAVAVAQAPFRLVNVRCEKCNAEFPARSEK